MTIAIQRPDPIAAAEAEIAGSKSLMAAVADDLSEHERWLAHYQQAEKRHARWVMLQELIYRTELALRRLSRTGQRKRLTTPLTSGKIVPMFPSGSEDSPYDGAGCRAPELGSRGSRSGGGLLTGPKAHGNPRGVGEAWMT